ncbi:MAG TPA: GNAT family protein [Vicinamibacterales bacterium]|nr:GNAT family protein [Vicinamibacterales bacterium]
MEKMPYQDTDRAAASTTTATSDWRNALPVMTGKKATLRELEVSDAPSLFAMLTPEEVSRFISPPPTSVEGFEKFIVWAREEREAGRYACFAVVPHGMDSAIGLFQVRQLEAGFATGEWGFALGSAFWGTGIFIDAGQLVVDFAVETLNVGRLEARACVANGRGNGALRKLGAVQEGVLRRSFLKNGQFLDQMLWSILAEEWRQAKAVWGPGLIH